MLMYSLGHLVLTAAVQNGASYNCGLGYNRSLQPGVVEVFGGHGT